MLIVPDLVSEYLMFCKTQQYFGSKLYTRIDVTGWKWLQWVSDPKGANFFVSLLIILNKITPQVVVNHMFSSVVVYACAGSK